MKGFSQGGEGSRYCQEFVIPILSLYRDDGTFCSHSFLWALGLRFCRSAVLGDAFE